jgi:hypothetical protein
MSRSVATANLARVADRGEQGHVVPLDGSVHGALQRLDVRNAVDIDAFLGEQGCQLAQHLVGHAGLELDPRRAWRRLGVASAHLCHGTILPGVVGRSTHPARCPASPRGVGPDSTGRWAAQTCHVQAR